MFSDEPLRLKGAFDECAQFRIARQCWLNLTQNTRVIGKKVVEFADDYSSFFKSLDMW